MKYQAKNSSLVFKIAKKTLFFKHLQIVPQVEDTPLCAYHMPEGVDYPPFVSSSTV